MSRMTMWALALMLAGAVVGCTRHVGGLLRNECKDVSWLPTPPADDPKELHFVGISSKFATEKGARNDAHQDAVNQFVAYTGVNVSVTSETEKQSQAKASEVADPLRIEREHIKTQAHAIVQRMRYRYTCTEVYQSPLTYVVKTDAVIPADEFEHVQAIKKKARDLHAQEASAFVASAAQDEGAGRVLAALQKLYRASQDVKLASQGTGTDLLVVQGQPLDVRISHLRGRILSGLSLQAVGPQRVETVRRQLPPLLRVRAIYHRSDIALPATGLPIVFVHDRDGAKLAANPDGSGGFAVQPPAMLELGDVTYVARIDDEALNQSISQAALTTLGQLQVPFTIAVHSVEGTRSVQVATFYLEPNPTLDSGTSHARDIIYSGLVRLMGDSQLEPIGNPEPIDGTDLAAELHNRLRGSQAQAVVVLALNANIQRQVTLAWDGISQLGLELIGFQYNNDTLTRIGSLTIPPEKLPMMTWATTPAAVQAQFNRNADKVVRRWPVDQIKQFMDHLVP